MPYELFGIYLGGNFIGKGIGGRFLRCVMQLYPVGSIWVLETLDYSTINKPLPCLGLLTGACGVHYSSDPVRRITAHKAIKMGSIPSSILIDDFAAALFTSGSEEIQIFSWKRKSTAYCLTFKGEGVNEKRLSCNYIGVAN